MQQYKVTVNVSEFNPDILFDDNSSFTESVDLIVEASDRDTALKEGLKMTILNWDGMKKEYEDKQLKDSIDDLTS